jgi:hypothetical protein
MTVQETPTVSVPRQAGPADPPPAPAPTTVTPAAPLLGRDRPLTADERSFAVGLAALVLVLGTIIVVGLLVGQYVWS